MTTDNHADEVREAGFGNGEKPLDFLSISPQIPGQSYPHHCPPPTRRWGSRSRSAGWRIYLAAHRGLCAIAPAAGAAALAIRSARQIDLLPQPSRALDSSTPTERRNVTMSLYKRNSIWWFSIFVDGERHCESTGTSNRRTAERIERHAARS